VRSLDDTMNEHSELPSIFCQVHHSWQLYLSPICDIIQPLPSLPALPACPRHWCERYILFHGWVTCYVTNHTQSSCFAIDKAVPREFSRKWIKYIYFIKNFMTSAKEVTFLSLFVCLLATLRKNFRTDLHTILREGWQWTNEQMIKFR